ncbi:unnamed protein product [Mortierella alpina]
MTTLAHHRAPAGKSNRIDTTIPPTLSKPAMPLASHSQSQSTRSAAQPGAARVSSRNVIAKGPALSSSSSSFEHARASRKHSSSNNHSHSETIDEAYEVGGLPDESRLGRSRSHSHSNSHSNSSSFSRTDALLARTNQGRIQSASSNPSASAAAVPDANFRAGIKLIQQAYEDKYQALEEEVNTWKWISEEQSTQMAAMAAELAKVEGDYAALRKEMAQLEMFRKAIVSMVDQHSGVSLAELEQSILGTIEADAENLEAGYDAAIDADTSSFMLDDDAVSSIAPLPAHGQHRREDYPTRERVAGISAAVASSFRFSPQRLAPRPRASTETAVRRPKSTQQNMDVKNRSTVMRESLSPLAHHSAPSSRRRTDALSDSSSSGLKMLQKSGSTDSLRKRNTISASSRPLYPAASHSSADPSKRHSSVSPLSPRVRAATSSSRAATGSNSFTSNSTPSTSPRQPLLNHAASTAAATLSNSMAARTARQHQQQKEYSLGVRSSMSHLAGGSGVAPKSSNQSLRERRQPSSEESPGVQRNQSSQSNGVQSSHRTHRSNSGAASVNALSPAAIELLREHELQQQREKEEDEESGTHRRRVSNGHAGRRASHHFQSPEDEDQRRSVHHTRTRSGTNGSVHSNHQMHSATEPENNVVHGHPLRSGNDASARAEASSPPRRRQSQLYADKAAPISKSSSISKATESQQQPQQQQSNGGVDASAFTMLYKEIRDSMDATSFGLFARVVTAFNEGEKTTEETLQEVGKIVNDQGLNQRFRDLIHQAIAEKESQLENDAGNETMEGDITLDLDQSLLVEHDDGMESGSAAEVSMAQDVTESRLTADTGDSSVSDDPDQGLVGAMGALELVSVEAHPFEEGVSAGHVEVLEDDDEGGLGMGNNSESKRASYQLHMRSV